MLHIFPSFDYGGQQRRFAALANGLGGEYHHCVVSLDGVLNARNLISTSATVEYRTLRLKKSSFLRLSNVLAFRKLFAEIKPDLLCTYNWGAIEAVIANHMGRSLMHVHFEDGFGAGETPNTQSLRRVLVRQLFLKKSMTVVPSRALERIAIDQWKLSPKKVRRIVNGVDLSKVHAKGAGPSSIIRVGTVGALRKEKNQARLIRTFAAASDSKNATLAIIGEGPERDALKELAQSLGATNRISMPGATAHPEQVYGEFDIFALSSDTEQAPLSLMEAMAAGLPVVATDVGDVAAMVSAPNRGFITPLGDDDAFAAALSRLLQDSTLRIELGAVNREKAIAAFSLDRMLTEHRELYHSILEKR